MPAAFCPLSPHPVCRRLLKDDLSAFRMLQSTALPAGAQMTDTELADIMALGELWGVFLGDRLAAALALLPMDAPCRPCLAPSQLASEGLCGMSGPSDTALLWAPAVSLSLCGADASSLLCLLITSAIRRADRMGLKSGLTAAVPVQGAVLNGFFDAGLRLSGLRPLLRLCPCFLFTLAPDDDILYNKEHQLRLNAADTRSLGRLLEEGWRATAYLGGELLLTRFGGNTAVPAPDSQEEFK